MEQHNSNVISEEPSSTIISEEQPSLLEQEAALYAPPSAVPEPPKKRMKKKKSKLRSILAIIVAVLIVIGLIIATMKESGSFFFSTAHVSKASTATDLNKDTYQPLDNTKEFNSDSRILYASAYIKNVSDGTKVSAIWYLPSNETLPTEKTFTLLRDGWVPFFLTSENGFPTGSYKVEIIVNSKVSETLTFTVK